MFGPTYGVKFFREGYYKLIRYHRPLMSRLPSERPSDARDDMDVSQDGRFASAISRARSVVFQLAFCNDWDYFFTGTIDRTKYDRHDLGTYYKALSQWVRDQSKKYHCKIQYVFVPELHKDGAWHIHGFVRGIPQDCLSSFVRGIHPRDLVEGNYRNWPAYQQKFGFCSLAIIDDLELKANYLVKYITKDLASACYDAGAHTYRASIKLARAVPFGYIYGRWCSLDSYLEYSGEFCDTGIVRDVTWDFWQPYFPVEELLPAIEYPEDIVVLSNVDDLEQLYFAGWCNGNIGLSFCSAAGSIPAPAPI